MATALESLQKSSDPELETQTAVKAPVYDETQDAPVTKVDAEATQDAAAVDRPDLEATARTSRLSNADTQPARQVRIASYLRYLRQPPGGFNLLLETTEKTRVISFYYVSSGNILKKKEIKLSQYDHKQIDEIIAEFPPGTKFKISNETFTKVTEAGKSAWINDRYRDVIGINHDDKVTTTKPSARYEAQYVRPRVNHDNAGDSNQTVQEHPIIELKEDDSDGLDSSTFNFFQYPRTRI